MPKRTGPDTGSDNKAAFENPDTNSSIKAPEASKKGLLRKRLLILALILVVFAAIIYGFWYFNLRGFVSTDDAFIDGDLISLGAKMLGRISQLTVDEGDQVSKDQLLVQLDDSDLQAQQAQVAANLELARQSVLLAKINLQKAEDDFNRANTQYKSHVIPAEQFDHISKDFEMARAQYNIELARVKAADAQLNVVETQLENTRIIAPVAGIIAKKWALPGDVVQPGQAIFTIYNNNQLWVTANFEETKLAAIHPGDPVEISVDAYDSQRFSGKVLMIGATAAAQFSLIPPNNASGNFTKVTQRIPVKISIDRPTQNPDRDPPALLPGMSVEVKVRVDNE
jgi:membrane fusion protein (multidrug efflux system)